METRVPADQGSSGAHPETGPDPVLLERLRDLEVRLDDLDAALHDAVPVAWRQALEEACRNAVAEELRAVSEDMRRAVSELGRLLLRDLDRLTKVLADHRDTIVERLLAEVDEATVPEASGATASGATASGLEATPDPAAPPDAGTPDVDAAPGSGALKGEAGRWRVLPGQRRARRSRRSGRDGSARR